MYLSEVTLKQFRSYEDARYRFDKKLTLITGQNGMGKTNLLESIYVLFQGGSFRVSDKDLIMNGRDWWRVDGVIDSEPRQVRYQLAHKPPKQLVAHDTSKRFMFKDKLPVVLFEPTELQLVHGSPTRRRELLDLMLAALSSEYKLALGRYTRALMQRNNILKQQPDNLEDVLFSWDVLLSEYGVAIVTKRLECIENLNQMMGGYYSIVAGNVEQLHVSYIGAQIDPYSQSQYLSILQQKLQIDRLRGTTSYGPHRDDIEFSLRGTNAKQNASRGEVRTLALALKMSYAALLEGQYGTKPIMLFDDVFSELDESRRTNLFATLGEYQTIITDTHLVEGASSVIRL